MKKATIVYIAVLSLFLLLTGFIFRTFHVPGNYQLAEFTTPAEIRKINVNTATAEQLQIIPGIGPAISERIITYRSENGPYKSIDELDNVKGIGEYLLSRLKIYTTVGD